MLSVQNNYLVFGVRRLQPEELTYGFVIINCFCGSFKKKNFQQLAFLVCVLLTARLSLAFTVLTFHFTLTLMSAC